ncbi:MULTISPECIES: hypothetical protein [unclassified Rhodococcus (in: high G+C Gram-positive bacteria)]|uniref:hypothetical protein n=1 Tax=unclassified Rhodococcus (in: high G+C Gram-positive bacteria) TaxID=192944 RepID=UPI00339110CE
MSNRWDAEILGLLGSLSIPVCSPPWRGWLLRDGLGVLVGVDRGVVVVGVSEFDPPVPYPPANCAGVDQNDRAGADLPLCHLVEDQVGP